MLDQLFKRPHALARHRNGPLLEERLAFLTHLAERGCSRCTLQDSARDLLAIAKVLRVASRRQEIVTRDDIKRKTAGKPCLYPTAIRWLQFVGRLQPQPAAVNPYAKKLHVFAEHMERDKGLSPATIRGRCWLVARFLSRLKINGSSLRKVTLLPDAELAGAIFADFGRCGLRRGWFKTGCWACCGWRGAGVGQGADGGRD